MVVLINTSDVLDGKVTNHAYVPNENLRGQFKKSFQQDDILYSEIRPKNRRFAYVDFVADDYVASTKLMVIRANDKVLPQFLFQVLKSGEIIEQLQLLAETRSGTFPQITFSELAALDVRMPSIAEQREIAATLNAIDEKIANNTAINNHLEQMAQAIFKSWFVDFEPTKPFTEVVQVLGGGTPKTTETEYWDGAISFFTPKDTQSLYVLTTEKTLTEAGLSNCNSRLYPVNTVFVTARGTVGKLAIAGVPMAMNQSCYALVGNNGYGQHFVYHLALETVEHLKHKASGAVFDAIVTRDFDSEIVVAPPLEAVIEFEDKVKPIYDAILNNVNESARLAALRYSLLPKLISGELSVADLVDAK
jgi:type I restriction enzyme S subunit